MSACGVSAIKQTLKYYVVHVYILLCIQIDIGRLL